MFITYICVICYHKLAKQNFIIHSLIHINVYDFTFICITFLLNVWRYIYIYRSIRVSIHNLNNFFKKAMKNSILKKLKRTSVISFTARSNKFGRTIPLIVRRFRMSKKRVDIFFHASLHHLDKIPVLMTSSVDNSDKILSNRSFGNWLIRSTLSIALTMASLLDIKDRFCEKDMNKRYCSSTLN